MIRCPLASVDFVDINKSHYRVEVCRPEQIYRKEAGWHWVVCVMLTKSDGNTISMYLPGNCSLQALQIAVSWIPHWLAKRGIEVDARLWWDADRIASDAAINSEAEFVAGCKFSCRSAAGLQRFQIVLFEPSVSNESSSIFVHMGEIGSESQIVRKVSGINGIATITEAIREVYSEFATEFPDNTAEFLIDGFENGGAPLSYLHMTRMLFGSTYTNMFVAEHESVSWIDPFKDKEPS